MAIFSTSALSSYLRGAFSHHTGEQFMRVTFQHNDRTSGFFSQKHTVAVVTNVQFSDEELAIINSRKLKKFVVLNREADAVVANRFKNDPEYLNSLSGFDLTVASLVKGPDSYACETPVHAKQYEENVTDALKSLKNFIMGNADKAESKTIEI
jgi:hypothetical protein